MKASEILRSLADKLDAMEQPGEMTANHLTPVEVDNVDHTEPGEKMIPPLQQKIELLKKATGVESEFDADDELAQLKKNAGVPIAAVHIASDDEPLDM
jgi:hypothetical protein